MTEVWAYIARTQGPTKGHAPDTVVACAVDRPEFAKDNARCVARWMRQGLAIERVPVAWVREHFLTTDRYVP
jgi:hypothetical protein